MIYITAFFFVSEGKEDLFQDYEQKVLPLMDDYNGNLIYRIRLGENNFITSSEEMPYEIHFISFSTDQDFFSYVNDERRQKYMGQKEEAIRSTFLVKGEKI